MKHVVIGALNIVMARIKQCGKAQAASLNAESISHWFKEATKANLLKRKIEKRFNVTYNVLYIDFKNKKRVA